MVIKFIIFKVCISLMHFSTGIFHNLKSYLFSSFSINVIYMKKCDFLFHDG